MGTCREPFAAGLVAQFGIVWPEPAHGATCPAWKRDPAEALAAVWTAAARGGWPEPMTRQWLADAEADPLAVLDVLRREGPTT